MKAGNRKRIFSVTKKDFVIEDVRGSGPGGQHRNKSYTGVRITHPESGAVGLATDSRSHETNQRNAFLRMVETPEFKVWLDLKIHPEQPHHRKESRRCMGTDEVAHVSMQCPISLNNVSDSVYCRTRDDGCAPIESAVFAVQEPVLAILVHSC